MTSTARRDERGVVRGLVGLMVVVLVAVGVAVAVRTGFGPLPDPDRCTLQVGESTVRFDIEQSENAALIAAIGLRRGLPARAVSIALATAMQESKLHNINRGDRDSLGLFQQRPSQGWGTPSQILDPIYATRRFYSALVEVEGYESLPITEAAQAVQRSAYPDAYAAHEPVARELASALTGYTPEMLDCFVAPPAADASESGGPAAATARSRAVRNDLLSTFGRQLLGRVTMDGALIEVEVDGPAGEQERLSWAVALYSVARADLLDIDSVRLASRAWKADGEGWRTAEAGSPQLHITTGS